MAWCYLPDTASASVQAAADLTWVLDLPSRALPPPVMSNGTNTPDRPSSPGSAPDTCTPRRSGTMSKPSTHAHGAGSLTPCWQATPASRFPKRDNERARMTPATSGPTSHGSSANLATGCAGSSLKTSRDISVSALKPWSAPYSEWVSVLRLAYSRRKKQVRRMKGSGSSSWPTAKALTGGANSNRKARNAGGPDLQEAVENWPTPMAGTPAQNGNSAAGNSDFTRNAEDLAAQMWTTPQAHDVSPRGSGQVPTGKAGNACLARDAMNWPTPSALQDTKSDADLGAIRKRVRDRRQIGLAHFVQTFTPPDQRTWTPGVPPSIWRPISRQLFRCATSRIPQKSLRLWWRRGTWRKPKLNSWFVEWLMGWPPGHALCACSATAFIRWQQDMRGALSAMPTASAAWTWEPPMDDADKSTPVQMDLFGDQLESPQGLKG